MSYVAMSRVTHLLGLHLIKFCKERIEADSEAVKEYNRLRQIYRPDLPQFEIPIPVKKKVYTSSATFSEVAVGERKEKGFVNPDRISCYANSVTQMIIRTSEFENIIKNAANQGIVSTQLKKIVNDKNNANITALNVQPLRVSMGGEYAGASQQDAHAFLLHLIDKLREEGTMLWNLLVGFEGEEFRCSNQQCTYQKMSIGHTPFIAIQLKFPDPNAQKISFQEMLLHWSICDGSVCILCQSTLESRTTIRSTPPFLFINLAIFKNNNTRIGTKITNFTANEVTIFGAKYVTLGAICHAGTTIESGHYWTMLKYHDSWLCLNDNNVTTKKDLLPI